MPSRWKHFPWHIGIYMLSLKTFLNKLNIERKTLFVVFSFLIIFAGFFYVLVSSYLWDYDFWWHISTGRYIAETKTLPDKDPFSYVANLEENKNLFPEREQFILKQYWLAQVIFYLIFESTGPKGIILLKAILLTMTLFFVFLRLRSWNVNFYISFIMLFLLYLQLVNYAGERPVLFTVLFTVVTFSLLERFKERKGKGLLLLCPLMLLWSNLHGGFILGNVLIIIYMLCEGIKIIFKKGGYTSRETAIFYTATALSLICSYINPTGWDAFSIALSPEYKFMETGIQEYQSPFFLYKNKLSPISYGYLTLMGLFPLILILRNRKLDLTHVFLLAGLFFMAAKTARYAVFYASIASMVLGRETNLLVEGMFKKRLSVRSYGKMMSVFSIIVLLSSLLFLVGIFKFEKLRFSIASGYSVPESAVNFIEDNKIQGNLFNDGGYGGYIAWRLYPWKKTFTDTRWLNHIVQSELSWIVTATESIYSKELPKGKRPLWRRLLDHYNVNLILLPILDVYGNVPSLILKLADDTEWVPVYADLISVVFIKNKEDNQEIIDRFRLSKDYVYNIIIAHASKLAIYNNDNPQLMITLGRTFREMGRTEEALTAYQYAYKRMPDESFKREIEDIEIEIKGKIEK